MKNLTQYAVAIVIWALASSTFIFVTLIVAAEKSSLQVVEITTWRLFALIWLTSLVLNFFLVRLNQ